MSARRTSPPRPRLVALQIKLPCATREELKREHGAELSRGTFFVRTRAPKAANTLVRFELRLEQGEPFLRGLGVVAECRTEADYSGQAGMLLQLRGLDATSHLFLQGLGLRVAVPTIRSGLTGDPESRRYLRDEASPEHANEVIEASPGQSAQSRITGGGQGPRTAAVPASALPRAAPPPTGSGIRSRAAPPPPELVTRSGVTRSGVTKSTTTSGVTRSGVTKGTTTSGAMKSGSLRTGAARPRTSIAPRSGPIVGIDFGASQTCVGWFADDVAQLIPSPGGESRLQSLFGVDARGQPLVGMAARKAVLQAPQNAIRNSRRLVGRSAVAEVTQELQKALPFSIVAGRQGQVAASLAGHSFPIEDVASRIIGETAGWAEKKLGRSVGRAVLTVPAAATVSQRQAFKDAAELAGLSVERIVMEPVAAALAYAAARPHDQKLVVFRMGAGSFDVAILEQKGKTGLDLLAVGGDTLLGGSDFDQLLLDVLLKRFEEEQGATFSDNPIIVQRFADAAEQAKIALSSKEVYNVGIPFIAVTPRHSVDFDTTVTRAELEQLVAPLVDRALEITQEVLASRKIRPTEIGELLVIGGQSRTPLLLAGLKQLFGREPTRHAQAEDIPALGASILAHRIATKSLDGLNLELLPSSLGVGLKGGGFQKLFERYAVPPQTATYTAATERDDQSELEVCFFQGESKRALENDFVGSVRIEALPPGPAGSVKMDLALQLTPDGTLTVAHREPGGVETTLDLALARTSEQLRTTLGDTGKEEKQRGRVWKAVRGLFRKKKA